MNSEITVRHCRGIKEMDACVELQRRVCGEKHLEIVPNTVLVVAARAVGPEALEGRASAPQGEAAEIVIPENVEDRKAVSIADVARIQERVMAEFEEWFARGYTAIATARSRQGFKYMLDSKFRGGVNAPLQKPEG